MAGYWPRFFFAFWFTLTSPRSYPVCQRLIMRGSRFRSSLKKWPARKHALLISMMAGYWPSYFCVFMDRDTLGTRGIFLRATTSFVGRRPRTRAAKPREKTTWYPGYLGLWKTQKTTWPISSHHACQRACFSHRSLFKTWPKPGTAHEKPLAQGRTETKSRSIKTLKKARPISSHHPWSTMHVLISYLTFNKFICYNEF